MVDSACGVVGRLVVGEQLAWEIRRLRHEAGLSQPEVAARIGYTRQYVSLAERPRKGLPSAGLIAALDAVLEARGALIDLRERAVQERCSRREFPAEHGSGEAVTPPPPPRSAPVTLLDAQAPAGWSTGSSAAAPPPRPAHRSTPAGLTYSPSLPATVEVVAELGRHDMQRRDFLVGAAFAVAASVTPSRDWLLATLDEAVSARGKVNSAQVTAIRDAFGVFQELDVMRGGGHARTQLASYFNSDVLPLLRTNDASTASGQALCEAASEQLYLLGWMAFDNGEHPLAQRYLIQSLRLAQAAGRPELGAHVLAGLSDQATLTGHPDHGVQLARAGRAGLERGHSNACLADLYALQARAQAAMGDEPAAATSVHRSEQAYENVTAEDEPEWARFIDAAYLNGEYAHVFRDLKRSQEAAHFASRSITEATRQNRARRGSLAQAAMARARLDAHDLTAAASAAVAATKLAVTVKSARSVEAVTDLRVRLRDHRGSPAVRDFLDISAAFMPALEPLA